MHRRRIQLVAGSTFSLSLPKEWVLRSGLRSRDELMITERDDGSLTVSSREPRQHSLENIALDIGQYLNNIDQVLFAVYFLGIENIELFSQQDLAKDVKARIRKTLTHMSGTEITYEDKRQIRIRVLLDKSKVDIIQVMYRISLIIDSTVSTISNDLNLSEIKINENEIDRLYFLISKIIYLSLRDAGILQSSGIRHATLIPSFFLIAKRLENIGDNLNHLAEHLAVSGGFRNRRRLLGFVNRELARGMRHLMQKNPGFFGSVRPSEAGRAKKGVASIRDDIVKGYMTDIVRFLLNIHEELVNISFYGDLMKRKIL